jgi:hypothetical protein
MKTKIKNNGSVFLMVVFVIALLAALTMGILQMNTEEVQLMRNQIYAAQALAVAEAGLNDAFAEIRMDDEWDDGFNGKPFLPTLPPPGFSGSYDVGVEDYDGDNDVSEVTIVSVGTMSQGFVARVAADITVGGGGPPYVIRIDQLRINE